MTGRNRAQELLLQDVYPAVREVQASRARVVEAGFDLAQAARVELAALRGGGSVLDPIENPKRAVPPRRHIEAAQRLTAACRELLDNADAYGISFVDEEAL